MAGVNRVCYQTYLFTPKEISIITWNHFPNRRTDLPDCRRRTHLLTWITFENKRNWDSAMWHVSVNLRGRGLGSFKCRGGVCFEKLAWWNHSNWPTVGPVLVFTMTSVSTDSCFESAFFSFIFRVFEEWLTRQSLSLNIGRNANACFATSRISRFSDNGPPDEVKSNRLKSPADKK